MILSYYSLFELIEDFFVFAATASDINGVTTFKPGLIKLSQAFLVPLKNFCSLLLIELPSSIY